MRKIYFFISGIVEYRDLVGWTIIHFVPVFDTFFIIYLIQYFSITFYIYTIVGYILLNWKFRNLIDIKVITFYLFDVQLFYCFIFDPINFCIISFFFFNSYNCCIILFNWILECFTLICWLKCYLDYCMKRNEDCWKKHVIVFVYEFDEIVLR